MLPLVEALTNLNANLRKFVPMTSPKDKEDVKGIAD